jgi:hypothetical protein
LREGGGTGRARSGSPRAPLSRLDLQRAIGHIRGMTEARRVRMKKFLLSLLTWWNSETLNTRFFTWRKGREGGRG